MKKAADFIMGNWRPLALAYVAVAVLVFIGILIFFWVGWKETEREKEIWPDFEYGYPEESGWNKAWIMTLALFIAAGCAVLWPAFPLLFGGVFFLSGMMKRFPALFGNMLDGPQDPDGD